MNNKISLLYIVSNGRSGSTILDMLLGTHPELWTMGEAQILPWEMKENRAPCGCGKMLGNCKFWENILPKINKFNEIFPIHYFRESHGTGSVLRLNLLPSLFLNKFSSSHFSKIDAYGKANKKYFEAIYNQAQKENKKEIKFLIDASKDLYRLFWLKKSGLFDIKVIHLVKDPRAFVYSMTKNERDSAFLKTTRMALRWKVENYLMKKLLQIHFKTGETKRISYKRLASNHVEKMDEIFAWMNLKKNVDLEKFRNKKQHAVSGNKARWESRKIYLDEKWKVKMPKVRKSIVDILT